MNVIPFIFVLMLFIRVGQIKSISITLIELDNWHGKYNNMVSAYHFQLKLISEFHAFYLQLIFVEKYFSIGLVT